MIELNALLMYPLNSLIFFLVAFFITFFLTPFVSKVAIKTGVLDVPDGKLKNHEARIPYLGGVAIYLGLVTTVAILWLFRFDIELSKLKPLFLGITSLLILGLIDDLFTLTPLQKLIGQILASMFFLSILFAGIKSYLLLPMAFFWVLTLINAFNLIDVMDGLTAVTSICATCSFLFFIFYFGLSYLAFLVVPFLGCLFAFLYYNKPSAKIYLGDAGSLFIGGFLGVLPFLIFANIDIYKMLTISVVILLVPILELLSLIFIRIHKGIPFYLGSPDHFSIYLRNKGWSKHKVLFFVAIFSIALLVISVLFALDYINLPILFLFLSALLALWGIIVF